MNVCVKCWAPWTGETCECGCTAYWRLAEVKGNETIFDPPITLASGGSVHTYPAGDKAFAKVEPR